MNSEGKSGATADDDDSIPSEEEEELELDDEADDATDAIYEALPDNVKQVLNNFFKNSQAGEEAKADAMIVARAIYDLSDANGCPNLYRCFEKDDSRSGWNNTVYYGGAVNDLKRVIVRRSKELSRTVKLKDSNRSRIWLKVVKCGKQVTAARDRASSSSSYQRTPIPPGNHTRMLLRFMGGPTAVAGDGDGDDDDDFGGGGIHQGLLPGQDYDAVEDISGDDDDNDDNHNDDELNDDSQALGSTNDPISNRQSSTRL